ncbi:MAG: hypothetical protein ACI4D1_07110 [Lachnospira sp.]
MDIIKYDTTLKASGKDYSKIVFWNRFIRNPIELILSWTPAIISLILLICGIYSSFLLILYAVCWFYPIYIFAYQFRTSVNYHLKHRDPSEDAPCSITLMDNAIMADIPEHDLTYTYEWNQFTSVYSKFGYFMLFNKGRMIVMLCQKDMPDDIRDEVPRFIKSHVDRNICKIYF